MLKGNSGFGGSRGLQNMGAHPPQPPMNSLTMQPPIVSPMSGGNNISLNPPPTEPKPVPPAFPPSLNPILPDPSPYGPGGIGNLGGGASPQKPPMGLQRLSAGPRQPGLM